MSGGDEPDPDEFGLDASPPAEANSGVEAAEYRISSMGVETAKQYNASANLLQGWQQGLMFGGRTIPAITTDPNVMLVSCVSGENIAFWCCAGWLTAPCAVPGSQDPQAS